MLLLPEGRLLLQVDSLFLDTNALKGTLPDSWSNFSQARMQCLTVYVTAAFASCTGHACPSFFATMPSHFYNSAFHVPTKQLFTQLQHLSLAYNQLVGTLPETWSNLTSVRPVTELAC